MVLGSSPSQTEAKVILIEHHLGGQPTRDIIDDLALQFPDKALVAILPEGDPLIAQEVILAGARAFLLQPFTQVNLLSTLRRVRDLHARQLQLTGPITTMKPDGFQPMRTLAVFSPRGGVGCSTMAYNLAIALYQETVSKVLLMEGKLFFGHLEVMLNIRTNNNLADLIPYSSSMDETLVREVVNEHTSGIFTLVAPSDFQVAQGIKPKDMFAILTGLQNYFDFIVIDTGSNLDENTVTLLDASDRILLIASPELAALHDVSRFTRISHSLAYPQEKVLLVLNRANRPGGVKPKEIEAVIHRRVYAKIPDDPKNALRSLNRGTPLIVDYPRSPASRGIKKLAKLISSANAGPTVKNPSQVSLDRMN